MADDPDFKGVLIVGLADTMFFQPFDGYGGYVHKLRRDRVAGQVAARTRSIMSCSAGWRFSIRQLSAERVAQRLDPDFRPGVEGPYDDIWKLQEVGEHRADPHVASGRDMTPIWRAHARWAWKGFKEEFPLHARADRRGACARRAKAVATIRARGGE